MGWNEPVNNGGADVHYYTVAKCETSRLSWTTVKDQCELPSCRVIKLIKDNEYVFRICAVNQYGVGPALLSHKIRASHRFSVPEAPGAPKALRVHFNSITIVYQKPANDGGSKIIGYNIERLKNKGSRWARCNDEPVDDLQYRVTGLSENSSHEFRVVAENAAGKSVASETSLPIVCRLPASPPGIPGSVCVTETSTDSVSLKWEAPIVNNGSEVIGYIIEKQKFVLTDEEEIWIRTNEELVEECFYTVTDLKSEDYEFRVTAVNLAGEGPPRQCPEIIKPTEKEEEPQFLLESDHKSVHTAHVGNKLQLKASFRGK